MDIKKLIIETEKAMTFSYSPYSSFKVGATLLCNNGEIYTGCNIENASYSPTICAERTAIFKAVSSGKREFNAICIMGGLNGEVSDYISPCGVCRQVMTEFCSPDFKIILAKSVDDYRIYTLEELMPVSFSNKNLV